MQVTRNGGINGNNVAPRWREHACVLICNAGRRLVMFGGRDAKSATYFADTWMADLQTGQWRRVAEGGPHPCARCFNSDAGGARVMRSGDEEWAVLFGGLCQPGYRDAQTWMLGPLEDEPEAWSWFRVAQDVVVGHCPCARFHHSMTLVPRTAANWAASGGPLCTLQAGIAGG